MKSLVKFAAAAMTILAMAACNKPDDNSSTGGPSGSEPNLPVPAPEVSFSGVTSETEGVKYDTGSDKLSVTVPEVSGSASFTLKASEDWTIAPINTKADSWVSIAPTSGSKGEVTVKISVDENVTYDERSAEFEIKSGSTKKNIRVVQKQKDAVILTESKTTVGADGGEVKFEIRHNVDYTLSWSDGWISQVSTKALASDNVVFMVEKNESTQGRTAVVKVTSSSGNEEFRIYQDGAVNQGGSTDPVITPEESVLVLGSKESMIDYKEQEVIVDVTSNINVLYNIVQGADWVQEVSTKATSTDRYVFKVSENTTGELRQAVIEFATADGSLSEHFVISQAQKGVIVIAKSEYTLDSAAQQLGFEVSANVAYEVQTDVDWISQVQTKGMDYAYLEFNLSENTSGDKRTGCITIVGGGITQRITVTQQSFEAYVNVEGADEDLYFPAAGAMLELNVGYDSDFPFRYFINYITEHKNWITPVEADTKAAVKGVVRFQVAKNTDTEERSAIISFLGPRDNILKNVYVHQDASMGEMPRLEELTSLSRDKITNINFYVNSSVTTSHLVNNGYPVYAETNGTTLNVYTPEPVFKVNYCRGYFDGCTALKALDLSTWDTSGATDMTDMFSFCSSMTSIDVSSLDTSRSKKFSSMFRNCISLESLDLSGFDTSSVTDMTDMLAGITGPMKLKTLDLSNFDVSNARFLGFMFQLCANLETLDLRGWSLPDDANVLGMLTLVGALSDECEILASKTTAEWIISSRAMSSTYIKWTLDGGESLYRSTDFSKDGSVTLLQKASEGNGIDLVIMGDGYSDRQIASGKYRSDMNGVIDGIFSTEPLKSFKHLFNIYEVSVVSPNEGFYRGGETALESWFETPLIFYNTDKYESYVRRAVGEDSLDSVTAILLLNSSTNSGSADVLQPVSYDPAADYASGFGVAALGKGVAYNEEIDVCIARHEFGHAFAKLDEEYANNASAIPSAVVEAMKTEMSRGWWSNVDFTSNTSQIKWSSYISDPRYSWERIGAYEGASGYASGVWKPTEDSIMNTDNGIYNAPSREAFYRRIHKLAYGSEWEFDLEAFKVWDLERSSSAARIGTKAYSPAQNRASLPPALTKRVTSDVRVRR